MDLSKCKFGDKLRTIDGRMAVFLHKSYINHEVFICVIENDKYSHHEIKYQRNGKRYYDNEPSGFDIKGKWEERDGQNE